jgi:hypothetical protein
VFRANRDLSASGFAREEGLIWQSETFSALERLTINGFGVP